MENAQFLMFKNTLRLINCWLLTGGEACMPLYTLTLNPKQNNTPIDFISLPLAILKML
jgi:hypothetical protein